MKAWLSPDKLQKALWILVIIAMIASLPLILSRIQAEKTTDVVDMVYDYQDLFTIAHYQTHPEQFLDEKLNELRAAGVTTISLFESNLSDLAAQRRLQYFNSVDLAAIDYRPFPSGENYTYVYFTSDRHAEKLKPMIQESFEASGVEVNDWHFRGYEGLVIKQSQQAATIHPMEPDPIAIEEIQAKGFQVAVRLSDNRPFDAEKMDKLLSKLSNSGVRWIIFAGGQVTGYEDQSMRVMADLMNQHGIGLAAVELLNVPQLGIANLAYYTDYHVVRLHSILEGESAQSADTLKDRILLAVKDRNIRMVYLNGQINRDQSKAVIKDTLSNVINALSGPDGAIQALHDEGFETGQAEPFTYEPATADKLLRLIVLLGSIALITILFSKFTKRLTLTVFFIGCIGAASLDLVSSVMLQQLVALGVTISAASLAGIIIMQKIKQSSPTKQPGFARSVRTAVVLFLQALGISLIGVLLMTGLLNQITYMLVIEQFRGVTLLKLAPFLVVGLYYLTKIRLLDSAEHNQLSSIEQIKSWLNIPIRLSYVMIVGILGMIGIYYLSRAGNQGVALPYEHLFRAFLEQTLGVRPRTQEFLIGHPLFLLGTYLAFRYRKGMFIVIFGVLGQLTMIGTFTHLHTPWDISVLRSIYGAGLGLINGVILMLLWETVLKGWRTWKAKSS